MTPEEIGGAIITCLCYGIVVLATLGIGIHQYRMKTPATFYTGEKAPDPAQVRDLRLWNRRHGLMWIGYALLVTGCMVASFFTPGLWQLLPLMGGMLLPLPFMIAYHEHLKKTCIVEVVKNDDP